MSTLETDIDTQDTETAERPFLRRSFAAQFSEGAGRTIDVRVVPYGEKIEHDDGKGGVPKGVLYKEEFAHGSFSDQVRAAEVGRAKKIWVNFEHNTDLLSQVGHGVSLREDEDGLHGTFQLHDDAVGEKALLLIREGALDGVSLEALPLKTVRSPEGIVRRTKAHLYGIALTRFPAYSGARVLALREEAELIVDEADMPVDMAPELVERCRRLGIKLPQRYEAHPDENGHPGETGTPEDGTRQTDANLTSSEES